MRVYFKNNLTHRIPHRDADFTFPEIHISSFYLKHILLSQHTFIAKRRRSCTMANNLHSSLTEKSTRRTKTSFIDSRKKESDNIKHLTPADAILYNLTQHTIQLSQIEHMRSGIDDERRSYVSNGTASILDVECSSARVLSPDKRHAHGAGNL